MVCEGGFLNQWGFEICQFLELRPSIVSGIFKRILFNHLVNVVAVEGIMFPGLCLAVWGDVNHGQ
jgi:hypothetical protein